MPSNIHHISDLQVTHTSANRLSVSYSAKHLKNTPKIKILSAINFCLKGLVPISKRSKNRLLGIQRLLPTNILTDLVLCPKTGNTVFRAI